MLQTRRSPSPLCTASMSDFCFVEDACQAKSTMGEGDRDVDNVCWMVKVGWMVAMRMEPFWYLECSSVRRPRGAASTGAFSLPDCVRLTVGRGCQRGDGIEDGPHRSVLGRGRLEEDDVALLISCTPLGRRDAASSWGPRYQRPHCRPSSTRRPSRARRRQSERSRRR